MPGEQPLNLHEIARPVKGFLEKSQENRKVEREGVGSLFLLSRQLDSSRPHRKKQPDPGLCGSPQGFSEAGSDFFAIFRNCVLITALSWMVISGSLPTVMEYEIARSAKSCTATGREFVPGETFFSALIALGAELKRCDYSTAAWQGPPPGTVGWWKSQMSDQSVRRSHWAPNDVLLSFFDDLAEQPDKQDMRYVLALLLVRRRVMRMEEEQHDEAGRERLLLYCPRRDTQYEVPAVPPDPQRTEEIQQVRRSSWSDEGRRMG